MSQAAVEAHPAEDPRRKLDRKVIAPAHARRRRAQIFQTYVLVASAAFVGLAVGAHFVPYFPIDLVITRAIQNLHGATFENVMYAISWTGFVPQVDVLAGLVVLLLYAGGLRWEAINALIAGAGVLLGAGVKLVVARPRPGADLVHVFSHMDSSSFPSGHVLMITAFGGYLVFLAYTLFKASWGRTLLLTAFGLIVALMGMSRIDLGHHWFSDVMGAYVLGSLWLALTIRIYRWGKPRFFVDQPVAHPHTTVAAHG
jgi:membrane-associated phospholipid phosphatase